MSTLSNNDSTLASVQDECAATIVKAIKIPNVFRFDELAELTVVKLLGTSKKHNKTFALLNIFVGENYDAFKQFQAANQDYFKSVGKIINNNNKK